MLSMFLLLAYESDNINCLNSLEVERPLTITVSHTITIDII